MNSRLWLDGRQAFVWCCSLPSIPSQASVWCFSKELQRDKQLSDYVGKNDKTKVRSYLVTSAKKVARSKQ